MIVDPIERTVRLATTVETLPEAWALVMEWLDRVGPDPAIEITPRWRVTSDEVMPRTFTVVVSGMVEEVRP